LNDEYCRVDFFADTGLTQKIADFNQTILFPQYELTFYDANGKPNGLEHVDLYSEYSPATYQIVKTIPRDYYFLALSDFSNLATSTDQLSNGRRLCKTNSDYCYVFIWKDETLVPTNTKLSYDQTEGLAIIYEVINSEEDTTQCTSDLCLGYSYDAPPGITYHMQWKNP
jgi:hypothetical protein